MDINTIFSTQEIISKKEYQMRFLDKLLLKQDTDNSL